MVKIAPFGTWTSPITAAHAASSRRGGGWVALHGGHIWWRHELIRDTVEAISGAAHGPSMVSFDIDAVDQAFAPGVSAPATGGLTPDLWLHAAYCAGANPQVSSMDLVEMNPRQDRDGQTAQATDDGHQAHLPEDHPADASRCCAERHPQPDLARPL